jgi:hypothetical protein
VRANGRKAGEVIKKYIQIHILSPVLDYSVLGKTAEAGKMQSVYQLAVSWIIRCSNVGKGKTSFFRNPSRPSLELT